MASHSARRAIVEKQAAAQPASRDETDVESVSALAVTAGGAEGAYVCKHCFQRFETSDDLGGCRARLFHPGQYRSGKKTVWNGPDYFQYDDGTGGWSCCAVDSTDKRSACRARFHELAAIDIERTGAPPRRSDEDVTAATEKLARLCRISAQDGSLNGEARDGRTAGSFRSPDNEIAARSLIDDLGADVNGATHGATRKTPVLSLVALAAQQGHAAMLSLLFEKGASDALANAPQVSFSGVRPLWLALKQNWVHPGHVRAAWVLCCHGADPRLGNGERTKGCPNATALELVPGQFSRDDDDSDVYVLGAVLDRVFAAAVGGSAADPGDVVGLVSREPAKLAALFAEARAEAQARAAALPPDVTHTGET
jgi:hypothetical protein